MLFNFPFKPYPQQEELMIAIENCIAQRHSGCFESPTGTGKSLSAICSTLHWLLGEETRIFSEMDMKVVKVDSDDWLSEITSDKSNDNISEKMLQAKDNYKSMTARIASSKADMLMGNKRKRNLPSNFMNHSTSTPTHDTSSQNEFLLPDYDSSEEFGEDVEKEHCDPDDIDALDLPQILYCSRTHSQLAQFVAEVKKTAYKDVRCVILGSRKSLCINQGVVNSSGETELNEKCLEMQKNKDKNKDNKKNTKNNEIDPALPSPSACCGFHSKEGERQLSDLSLSEVTDLEDILSIAIAAGPADEAILPPRKVSFNILSKPACPYYASRLGVKKAQLVCMPYNMLLQTELRQSLGLSLKNKVVVVDEAHNLVEAINQMHSATVSSAQLEVALQAVSQYVSRFSSVLSGKNSYNLKVLMAVVKKLIAKAPRMAVTSGATTASSAVSTASTTAGAPDGGGNNSVSTTATASNLANTGTTNTATQSIGQSGTAEPMASAVRSVNDFLFSASLDNINMLKLAKFIGANRLIEKVSGHYVHHCSSAAIATEVNSKAQSSVPSAAHTTQRTHTQPIHLSTTVPTQGYVVLALRSVLNLLRCFVNVDSDGRVVFRSIPATTSSPANNSVNNSSGINGTCRDFTLSYLMLNPATHFQPILSEARSVVLLGGTLQPFDHLVSSLFPVPVQTAPQTAHLTSLQVTSQHSLETNASNAPNRSSSTGLDNSSLSLFACGHVVPPSHVKSLVVTAGPSGTEMQFTAEKRMSISIVNDLHAILVQIASTVPGGVVIFFSSYAYMDMVLARWRANNGHLMGAIERHKAVFVETKDKSKKEKGSGGVCNAWNAYCAEVGRAKRRGAMLFTVIGGSLSEGINFSDDLARCVVVVGMPYPDHRDPVFKEKISFAEKSQRAPGGGSRLLDSVCMNSVNQTIGRSIRHAGDFASIVLLDKRYAQTRIQKQLPGWIGREIECCAVTPAVQSSGSTMTSAASSSNTVNCNNNGIDGSSGGSRSLTACLSEFFALHSFNKDEK